MEGPHIGVVVWHISTFLLNSLLNKWIKDQGLLAKKNTAHRYYIFDGQAPKWCNRRVFSLLSSNPGDTTIIYGLESNRAKVSHNAALAAVRCGWKDSRVSEKACSSLFVFVSLEGRGELIGGSELVKAKTGRKQFHLSMSGWRWQIFTCIIDSSFFIDSSQKCPALIKISKEKRNHCVQINAK